MGCVSVKCVENIALKINICHTKRWVDVVGICLTGEIQFHKYKCAAWAFTLAFIPIYTMSACEYCRYSVGEGMQCSVCWKIYCENCSHKRLRQSGYTKCCNESNQILWICSKKCIPPKKMCTFSDDELSQLAKERHFEPFYGGRCFRCKFCERQIPGVSMTDFKNHQPVCSKRFFSSTR